MSEPGAGSGEGLIPVILVLRLLILADSCSQVASSAFPRCSHLLPLAASSLVAEGSGALHRCVCVQTWAFSALTPPFLLDPQDHEQAVRIGFEGKTMPLHL